MHYTVTIKPSGYNLLVRPDETILSAAFKQGYRFPHECESGVCGACKGKLLEGHVSYDEPFLPALSDEEREAGWALFCSAKPASDLIIHVENVIGPEQLPIKKLIYSVKIFEQLTTTIYRVVLQPPANDFIQYRAGQYVEILQRDSSPKPFSIANMPTSDNKDIEFHIRHNPDNPYTSEVIDEIKAQQQLHLRGPFGSCILRKEPPYPLIFLAGGAGFAPIKALIEQALTENVKQPIYLYWGVRIIEDFYCHDLVLDWAKCFENFHYIPVLSGKNEKDKWHGKTGWVHEIVLTEHSDLANFRIYASGPIEMVYAALHAFEPRHLKRALMHSDMFAFVAE